MRNGFDLIKNFYSWVFNNQRELKSQHIALYMFLVNQNNRNNWVEWFKCPYDLGMAGSAINSKKTYYNTLHQLEDWGLIGYQAGHSNHRAPLISLLEISLDVYSPVPKSEVVGFKNEPQELPKDTPQELPQEEPKDTLGTTLGFKNEPQQLPQGRTNVNPKSDTYKTYNQVTNNQVTSNSPPVSLEQPRLRYSLDPSGDGQDDPLPDDSQKKKVAPKKKEIPTLEEFLTYAEFWMNAHGKDFIGKKVQIQTKYQTWVENGWKDGFGKAIKNWKTKFQSTEPHIKSDHHGNYSKSTYSSAAAKREAREPQPGTGFGKL